MSIYEVDVFRQIEVKYDNTIDGYRVYIHTPFYIHKIIELSHSYSIDWSERQIVEDIIKYYLKGN